MSAIGEISALQEKVAQLEAELQGYKEAHASECQLTRELDVILNGDGAAKQASLCDIVGQAANGGLPMQKECERLRVDAARLDFVDENLCMAGAVMDKNGQVVGIRKRWQVVTQYNDSLREAIDILSAQLTKEPNP